jgi:hypothetical protein
VFVFYALAWAVLPLSLLRKSTEES